METIQSSLTFLARSPRYDHEKPYIVVPPADGPDMKANEDGEAELHNLDFVEVTVPIYDIRSLSSCDLSTNGFQTFEHDFGPFTLEEGEVMRFRQQTVEALKSVLNAEHVQCYDFKCRRNQLLEHRKYDVNDPLLVEGPPTGVHIDLTPQQAAKTVRTLLREHGLAHYLRPGWRLRVVNTWRPLTPKLEDRPLAFCDASSLKAQDLVATDRIYPHRETELYFVQHNEGQKWYWFPEQTPKETLMMLMFDTHPSGKSKHCPHVSFSNPRAPPEAPPRVSVETRSIVITKA